MQRVTAKARLRSGLTRRGGDKCGGDAASRRNSLTARFACVRVAKSVLCQPTSTLSTRSVLRVADTSATC